MTHFNRTVKKNICCNFHLIFTKCEIVPGNPPSTIEVFLTLFFFVLKFSMFRTRKKKSKRRLVGRSYTFAILSIWFKFSKTENFRQKLKHAIRKVYYDLILWKIIEL